jgi:hypothetical protein
MSANNKFEIINDTFISINDVKYKCSFIDDNTINIESKLLGNAIHKNVIEFLSNKNIVIDECEERDFFVASNVKNSNIIINKLMLHYQSDCFEYNLDENTLIELDENLDYESRNGSKITVNGYYIYYGLEWSMRIDDLHKRVEYLMKHNVNDDMKIKIIHSDKLIGIENCLKKCFTF